MNRETFIKGIEKVVSKTNLPKGLGINMENICKDFALLAYDEALILHNVVGQSEQFPILDRCGCEEPNEEPFKVCMNCNGYVE